MNRSLGASGPRGLPGAVPVQFQLTFPGIRVELPILRMGAVRSADNELARNQLHLAGEKLTEAAIALGYKRAMPDSNDGYVHQARTAFGDMFVAALHTVHRAILALKGIEGFDDQVRNALSGLDALFPVLKGVRDSAAHVDERVQGKGLVKGKLTTIVPQMQTLRMSGGGSFTVAGNVRTVHHHGDESFGHGGLDGLIEMVSMKASDFLKAVEVVQTLANAFPWTGSSEVIPMRP